MSGNEHIELDVGTLLSQSASMKSLKEEYNGLFTKVTSILNEMNNGWSENLANNFVGKIGTAQKGFAKIVEMLECGENVAKEAATSFEDVNNVMARQISGTFASLFASIPTPTQIMGGIGLRQSPEVTEKFQSIMNSLPDHVNWENYKESLDFITDSEVYQSLAGLEEALLGTSYLSDADGIINNGVTVIDSIKNIFTGDFGDKDVGNLLDMVPVTAAPPLGYIVEGAQRFLSVENPQSYAIDYGYSMDSVIEAFKDGDILEGAAGSILYTAEAAGRTFVDIVGDQVSGITSNVSNVLDSVGVPVDQIQSGFENIVSDVTGYDYDVLTDAISQGISDGVDQMIDASVQGWGYIQDSFEYGANIVGDALSDGWSALGNIFGR